MFSERFKIDNIKYLFSISDRGEMSFEVLRGFSKKGAISWGSDNDDSYEDINIVLSPMKVLAKAKKMALDWVYINKPYRFGFVASTDRKFIIYFRMIEKIMNNNKFIRDNYNVNVHRRCFDFYRKVMS